MTVILLEMLAALVPTVPSCLVFPLLSLTALPWSPFWVFLPLSILSRLWLLEDLAWPSPVLLRKNLPCLGQVSWDSGPLTMLFSPPETFFPSFLEWSAFSQPSGSSPNVSPKAETKNLVESFLFFFFPWFYLFLAVLGLHCCMGFSLVAASRTTL